MPPSSTDPAGYFLTAVLEPLGREPRRAEAPEILARVLEEPMADDLRTFLRTFAERRPKHFGVGEFWLSDDVLESMEADVAQGHLCFGNTPGGDLWVVPRECSEPAQVFIALLEAGWAVEKAPCAPGLGAFFAWQYEEAQKAEEETSLDDYVSAHPLPPTAADTGPYGLNLLLLKRSPGKEPEAKPATRALIPDSEPWFSSPCGGFVLATYKADDGHHMVVLDEKRKKRVELTPPLVRTGPFYGAVHPDGKQAVAELDGTLFLISTKDGARRAVHSYPPGSTISPLAFLNDLVCVVRDRNQADLLKVTPDATAEVVATYRAPGERTVGLVRGMPAGALLLRTDGDSVYHHYLLAARGTEPRLVHRYTFEGYGEQLSYGWSAKGRVFIKSWYDSVYELEGLTSAVEQILAAPEKAWELV